MTETTKIQRKQLWEPFNEKEVAEGKKEYQQRIGAEKAKLDEYQNRYKQANNHTMPSMKAHFAAMAIEQGHYLYVIETFYDLAESLIEMHDKIGSALGSLQNQIDEIGAKTGVDISTVSTKVEELHTAFSSPKIDKIASFLDSMKKASEQSKAASEQYVE